MTHLCPYPNCTETLARDLLACTTHWYQLPAALRRRLQAAWRAYGRDRGTFAAYYDVRDEAVAFWHERAKAAAP